jgi:nucleoid-associated protein YgaU
MEKFSNLFERSHQSSADKHVQIYVVQEGDTLWSIAEMFLGDGNHYPLIEKANPNIGTDLMIGMNIKIPSR